MLRFYFSNSSIADRTKSNERPETENNRVTEFFCVPDDDVICLVLMTEFCMLLIASAEVHSRFQFNIRA